MRGGRIVCLMVVLASTWTATAHADAPDTGGDLERWSFVGSVGYGHQPSTGVDLFAWTLEAGLRPFRGALFTSLSLSGETTGERLTTLGGGLAIGWDLVYIVATHGFRRAPPELPLSVLVGLRLGLMWGRTERQIPAGEGTADYAFSLLRPEVRLFADVRVPLVRREGHVWAGVLRLLAYDTDIPADGVLELSRFSITAGVELRVE